MRKYFIYLLGITCGVTVGIACSSDKHSGNQSSLWASKSGSGLVKNIYSSASVEEGKALAKKYVIGVWTYTGQEFQFEPGRTTWIRWVVKPDGTIEQYWAPASADGWGKPNIEKWEIVSRKFTNSGERYYALYFLESWATTIIQIDGTLQWVFLDNARLNLVKGDVFPFSK